MKVAVLADWPRSEVVGGVQVHTVNLVRNLAKMNDLEIYVISFGEASEVYFEGRAKIVSMKNRRIYRFLPILSMIKVAIEVDRIKPDIIHIQGSYRVPYLLYVLLLAPRRYKKLMTIHGIVGIETQFDEKTSTIGKFLGTLLEKIAIARIPNLIVCSPAVKALLNEYQKTDSRFHVIPNGIEFEDTQTIKNVELHHPNVIFIGRLTRVKGVDVLIKAIPLVKEVIPNIHLYIIGSGPMENELKEIVKSMRLEENINFLGVVSDLEKFSYLKSADICVLPSFYEPFGIVLLEAMACKTAIIASDVGGIPYVLGDGEAGILFKCGDVDDLAKKIILLLSDERKRKELADAGYKRVKVFTWKDVALSTKKLYTRLVCERK